MGCVCAFWRCAIARATFRSFASTFFRNCLGSSGGTCPELNPATLHLLKQWDWPGNLRELENWIARAIILGDDEALGAELRRQVTLTSDSGLSAASDAAL